MSTADQRNARAALDAARPAVARLDGNRNTEDLAADLIDVWSAVEAALRALVGSSALTGQPLIREARQRQLIDFEQANTLAEFEAVHMRLQNTSYRPSEADTNAGRVAYQKFDAALAGDGGYGPPRPAPPGAPIASATAAPAPVVVAPVATTPVRRGMPGWLKAVLAAVVLLVVIGGGYMMFAGGGNNDALSQGVAAYSRGQRETAVSAFNKAARDNPKAPLPHIYLARMAREVGNFSLASQELQLALQAEPNNAVALREMGANLLQQGNNELARRFYVRAVQADPTDRNAQGYLGCSLMRLGRVQEGATFISRAGQGPWSSCTPAAPPQVPPGAVIPR